MKDPKKIEYLISLLFNTGRLIKEHSQGGEDIDPVSMLKLEALRLIEIETPTMKRIAEYLNIKAPSATGMIQGLVKGLYVKRTYDKDDRRIVRMVITDKGSKFLKKGFAQMTDRIKEVLSQLNQEKINNFIQIMEDIKHAYNK